jgi:hypothetical protein
MIRVIANLFASLEGSAGNRAREILSEGKRSRRTVAAWGAERANSAADLSRGFGGGRFARTGADTPLIEYTGGPC